MSGLTKMQLQALSEIADAGHASPYQLSCQSQVFGKLMRLGYIRQVREIIVWDKFSMFCLTPSGESALEKSK